MDPVPRTALPFAVRVAAEEKVVGELTVIVLLLSVPSVTLPYAEKVFPALTVTGALAVTAAPRVVTAATVNVLALLVPNTVFPKLLRVFPAVTLTAALAVMGAVDAKVVTALTCRLWLPLVPSTALPASVRLAAVLDMVRPPVRVVRPLLLMVRRSMSWVAAEEEVLPAALVLKIKLPPRLPAASCIARLHPCKMLQRCYVSSCRHTRSCQRTQPFLFSMPCRANLATDALVV